MSSRLLVALSVLALVVVGTATTATGQQRSPIAPGVFRADDGGAVYVRAVGTTVYAFAEHPGKGYAFVLRGTYAGGLVTGNWWDVPKHARTTSGTVQLQVSQGGRRLTRKSADKNIGVSVLTRISSGSVPWPPTDREAGFQTTRTNDLDGKFVGSDGRRTYLRETAGFVVGVSELRTTGTRPQWASVLIGARKANGSIAGTYADVPKGTRRARGNLGIAQVGGTRRISIAQTGTGPGVTQEPDYAVDFAGMASRVRAALLNRVVGFGVAVSKNAAVVAETAGGSRRLGQDDPTGNNRALPMNVTTQVETASSAKLVTAAMVIRTLAERGISIDAKVAGAVPTCWKRGPGITNTAGGLTWKQLLNHTSRLTRPSACDNNPYECLRRAILAGRVGQAGYLYQNINYTVMRYLLPTLRDKPKVDAIFAKHGCLPFNSARINAEVSELFRRYVSDDVLGRLGIVGTFEPVTEFAIRYDFSRPNAKGLRPSYKDILEAGSGGMKFSAREFAKFQAALEMGKIVPLTWLQTMRSGLLGYDDRVAGAAGAYPWKNGGAGGVQTWAMSFPSGIAAYVAVNSDNNNLSQTLGRILANAFDASIK